MNPITIVVVVLSRHVDVLLLLVYSNSHIYKTSVNVMNVLASCDIVKGGDNSLHS